jgi:hypothetical protein
MKFPNPAITLASRLPGDEAPSGGPAQGPLMHAAGAENQGSWQSGPTESSVEVRIVKSTDGLDKVDRLPAGGEGSRFNSEAGVAATLLSRAHLTADRDARPTILDSLHRGAASYSGRDVLTPTSAWKAVHILRREQLSENTRGLLSESARTARREWFASCAVCESD